MSALERLFTSEASFVLSALVVSWLAIVLLGLVAANLHVRLAHVERRDAAAQEAPTPYGHLLGRDLADALRTDPGPGACLALVLSSNCATCERVIEWLREHPTSARVVLAWRDGTPSPPPPLPVGATIVAPPAGHPLGLRVTPFALAADEEGRIVKAAPVGNVALLGRLVDELERGAHGRPDADGRLVDRSAPSPLGPSKGAAA